MSQPDDQASIKSIIQRHAIFFLLTGVACLATPMLPGVITAIFRYQFGDVMVNAPIIAEFQPFYAGTMGKVSLAIVLLTLALAALHRDRLRPVDWLILLFGLFLLTRMARFAPIFAIFTAPIIARTLPRFSDRVLARPLVAGALAIVLALGAWRIGNDFPRRELPLSAWLNRHGPDAPGYPCAAADFVASRVHPESHRVINEFTWGGYLSWRLEGQYQVFLDGRTQLYATDFWRATYLDGAARQRDYLQNITADAAILPVAKSQFAAALKQLGWNTIHRDDRAIVMVPPTRAMATSE